MIQNACAWDYARVCARVRAWVYGAKSEENQKECEKKEDKKKKESFVSAPIVHFTSSSSCFPPSLLASIRLLCFSTFCSSASSPAPSSLISISLFFFSLSLSLSLSLSFCLSLSVFFDLLFFFSVASCVSSPPYDFFSTIPFIYPSSSSSSSSSSSLFNLIIFCLACAPY